MTTEQMIEEALKEFEREFIDKVKIGEDEYDVALKDKPQDMFDFLKKQLTTIATKSAEEERERIAEEYGEYRYVTVQWFGYGIGEKNLRFYLLPHTKHKKGDDESISLNRKDANE